MHITAPARKAGRFKGVSLTVAIALWTWTATVMAGQAPIFLGSAANFAVVAGSTITSTGASVVGDVALSPGSSVTGFPPGTVNGTMHLADPAAAQAQADLTTAYNEAAGRTLAPIVVAGNLGGQTLAPGLYKSTSGLEITSGDLTLDAQGDPRAVFIFQMASTLTTTAGRQVILIGNAEAANVFWQIGTSATLGTTSVFKGTLMANQSISINTGAALEGRALARIGGVSLGSSTITLPTVTPASAILRFGPIQHTPNGSSTLIITNTAGLTFTLQTSTNLTDWTTLTTRTPVVNPDTYVDPTASTAPRMFYRAFYP